MVRSNYISPKKDIDAEMHSHLACTFILQAKTLFQVEWGHIRDQLDINGMSVWICSDGHVILSLLASQIHEWGTFNGNILNFILDNWCRC